MAAILRWCAPAAAALVACAAGHGEGPPACPADMDGDCAVGITDFLALLAGWS